MKPVSLIIEGLDSVLRYFANFGPAFFEVPLLLPMPRSFKIWICHWDRSVVAPMVAY